MNKISLLAGVVHELPDDMSTAIMADEKIAETWNALTPLARNEWICWTTIVKKEETRQEHIARLLEDLKKRKKNDPVVGLDVHIVAKMRRSGFGNYFLQVIK